LKDGSLSWKRPARLDEKGRSEGAESLPQQIEERSDDELFVTSITGRNFLSIRSDLARARGEARGASRHPPREEQVSRARQLLRPGRGDRRQGRVLVPQILRDAAKLPADVVVTGNIDHLVVSDRGALARRSRGGVRPEDYDELSKLLL
jgi:DNA-binding transcriptional regulator/RsmH inhibitor MraZ